MKSIYKADDPIDAHLLKGLLESNGIRAIVEGENVFGARGEAPLTSETLPTVTVADDADLEAAKVIVEQFELSKRGKGTQSTETDSLAISGAMGNKNIAAICLIVLCAPGVVFGLFFVFTFPIVGAPILILFGSLVFLGVHQLMKIPPSEHSVKEWDE